MSPGKTGVLSAACYRMGEVRKVKLGKAEVHPQKEITGNDVSS